MNQSLRVSIVSSWVGWLIACFGVFVLQSSPGLAQVNGPGPSPGSGFGTVFNLPGDEASFPGFLSESIVGTADSPTQLNVSEGGVIESFFFDVEQESELNIFEGGAVRGLLSAGSDSEVNIIGGMLGGDVDALSGSLVNVSGGDFDDALEACLLYTSPSPRDRG